MVGPLVVLAIFSILAGYVMVPTWFPIGGQWFDHFLEPVFEHAVMPRLENPTATHELEIGLTVGSVLIVLIGMTAAYFLYVKRPEIPGQWVQRLRFAYTTLYNKYYVDEAYDVLFVNSAKNAGNFFWAFDRNVVDGLVNFSAAFTKFSAWFSGILDVHIVDRAVNLVAQTVAFFSMVFRKWQTGLVQRYALFILAGIILFLSLYLYLGVS
jgi:NADH-quinone oxidoreductase subunit L